MLSDEEAAEIERQRRDRMVGPIVLTWVDRLLADRRERVRQLRYLRHRLRQAFRYLDGLFDAPANETGGRPFGNNTPGATPSADPVSGMRKSVHPGVWVSPQGIVYAHGDGRECRSSTDRSQA